MAGREYVIKTVRKSSLGKYIFNKYKIDISQNDLKHIESGSLQPDEAIKQKIKHKRRKWSLTPEEIPVPVLRLSECHLVHKAKNSIVKIMQ